MKHILKKILFSKYIYPVFRRAYYLIFRHNGGNGGRRAQAYLKQLNASEFSSLSDLEGIQNDKLKKLIEEAYENVPYYRNIMDQKKLIPSDIKTADDLKLLPVLTKQIIRDNLSDLVNLKYNKKKLIHIATGGTTGTPMSFFFSKHELAVRCAHLERWKKIAGVKQFDRFMYIADDRNAYNNPRYEGTFMHTGFFFMASFGLDDELMWKYYRNIKKFKPVYLRGYASGCYILADFFKRQKIEYPLKAVMTSSDTLFPHQRKVIEDVFSCKVFDFYHQSEDVVIATECEYHDGHHINMESCIVEMVDENDNTLSDGETGMMVGTQLENFSMPLIRYDTGDMGSITREKCSCGRNHIRIKDLFGRKDDIIITPDGKKIGPAGMSIAMKDLYEEILETQYIQKTRDELIVKIVATDKYTSESEKKLEKEIREQVGNLIKLNFTKVSRIPKTMRGKHRLIISEIVET